MEHLFISEHFAQIPILQINIMDTFDNFKLFQTLRQTKGYSLSPFRRNPFPPVSTWFFGFFGFFASQLPPLSIFMWGLCVCLVPYPPPLLILI